MSDVYKTPEASLNTPHAPSEYGSIEKALAGDYSMDYGAVFSEAWAKSKGSKLKIHIGGGIYFAVYLVALIGFPWLAGLIFSSTGLGALMAFLASLAAVFVTMPAAVGLFMMGIKRSVDEPFSNTEPLNYFGKIVPLALTVLIMYVMVIIGFILLVLPGIYLSIAYFYAMPLVVEKNMGPWQALETSRKAVTKKWFQFFFFGIIAMIIFAISMIPLFLGLIWTFPLLVIAYGIIYRNMFGYGEPQ